MAIDYAMRRFYVVAMSAGLALWATGAMAQSAPKPGDELRPLYALGVDIAEGKVLANSSCAKCHGADGVSQTKGVPSLAGQRPSYVYLRLKAYQFADGAAADNAHEVKFLSDEAIAKLAAYYASVDPALPPTTPAPTFVDPVAAGKAASAPCAKCHGDNGVSHKAGVPSLIGQTPKYLVESMKSYQSEDRPIDEKNKDMKTALSALTDRDLNRIALYYALQKDNLTRAQTPNDGGAPVTKEALAPCAKCHGETGIATSAITPNLAGQDATYMLNALHGYKDESRDDDTMSPKVKKLDDAAMKNFAAYFAALQPKPADIPKPLSPEEWADKCDRCHGVNGNSARPEVPALAAQRMDYLESVLREYQSGARKSPEMAAMSSVLTDDDVAGLAAHYAYQKARAVVFVTVPSR